MQVKHQWAVRDNNYQPAGESVGTLPPGMYEVQITMMGPLLEAKTLHTDDLFVLGGSPVEQVIQNVRRFWDSKQAFEALGLLHKRGVFLHGTPGNGKTAATEILAKDVIANDGVVLLTKSADKVEAGIEMVRSVEPDCKLVVIMEDFDDIVKSGRNSDSRLSNILDGENQVGNVVYVATTNHLDQVPARFKNRPSRFDEVVEIPLPPYELRLTYFQHKIPAQFLVPGMLEQWSTATDGLSIAHLREVIVGVLALGRPLDEVLNRLRAMSGNAKVAVPNGMVPLILGKGVEA